MFQRENDMRDIILSDQDSRTALTRFFFNRPLREIKSNAATAWKTEGLATSNRGPEQ